MVSYFICSDFIIEILKYCFCKYGKAEIIRIDNKPKFSERKFVSLHEFIHKGSPWENGKIEIFISKMRDKYLNLHVFESLE